MGEEAYNKRIIELLGKLPDPSGPNIGGGDGAANERGDEDSASDTWIWYEWKCNSNVTF